LGVGFGVGVGAGAQLLTPEPPPPDDAGGAAYVLAGSVPGTVNILAERARIAL
jgi:hypothetical protein